MDFTFGCTIKIIIVPKENVTPIDAKSSEVMKFLLSGGITEETTVMGVPCLTLRDNTERPETITVGTNELIGTDPKNIAPAIAA